MKRTPRAYDAKARLSDLIVRILRSGPRTVRRGGMATAALGTVERGRSPEEPTRQSLKDLLLAAEARTDALVPDRERHRHRPTPAFQ